MRIRYRVYTISPSTQFHVPPAKRRLGAVLLLMLPTNFASDHRLIVAISNSSAYGHGRTAQGASLILSMSDPEKSCEACESLVIGYHFILLYEQLIYFTPLAGTAGVVL